MTRIPVLIGRSLKNSRVKHSKNQIKCKIVLTKVFTELKSLLKNNTKYISCSVIHNSDYRILSYDQ